MWTIIGSRSADPDQPFDALVSPVIPVRSLAAQLCLLICHPDGQHVHTSSHTFTQPIQYRKMSYSVQEKPLYNGRKIRIICVGAGASGLLLLYKVKHNFYESDVEVVAYEKNADLGGTWLENRYVDENSPRNAQGRALMMIVKVPGLCMVSCASAYC